ncbi:MAG: winged helix-turn-helix transcriptional regulator [Nanoarchaeota archaeon]|nr:winged helix-turn-helix transcriptional regulator [Nanoarchaeota archaeon]MBU0963141.1 winged helix-turn-helix transcriptional regulator [Nanoarchaeota archaeon]
MKALIIILLLLITINSISAATLQGNVYDISLDKIKNVIVEINTNPIQRMVAKEGSYEFSSISSGSYEIKAYTNDKSLTTNESINIDKEGIYTYDLFLIPEFENNEKTSSYLWLYILIIIAIIGIILFILVRYYKKPKKEELIDKDLDYIIKIIKKEGNRIVQRDLVQKTGLSEAKISLMVTDLENKGIIRKIKKGRANILILNK